MPDRSIDPKDFWDEKILKWEKSRYERPVKKDSFSEKIAGLLSNSLRQRLAIARELILPYVKGKRIVELGCGSGFLAEDFIRAGAREYSGIDVSEKAISEAQRRYLHSAYSSQINFSSRNISSLEQIDADIVISLGLLDWLDKNEINKIFKLAAGISFFHSISEKRPFSVQQIIHRLYVYLSYGHKTGAYIPHYYYASEIMEIAARHTEKPINCYRTRRLSFSIFLTTLPINK